MAGPLVAACASWVAVERMHAVAPERVMSVMLTAFMAKMMFFGVYVAGMLRGLELRRTPFVVSFTVYFIALYAMEALFLKRLFESGRAAVALGRQCFNRKQPSTRPSTPPKAPQAPSTPAKSSSATSRTARTR